MKKEKLYEVLGDIDEKHIKEAHKTKAKTKMPAWVRWGAIAACLCLAVYTGVRLMSAGSPSDVSSKLPSLQVQFENNGMGFEGLMLHDISESGSANPWTEELALKTLPVYENLAYTDASGLPVYLSDGELLKTAKAIAAQLNVNIINTAYDRGDAAQLPQDANRKSGSAYRLTADTEKHTIFVYGDGSAAVNFKTPDLLDTHNFTLSFTSNDEAEAAIGALMEKYSSLLDGKNFVRYTWCDYFFTGEQNRRYYVYEDDADPVQKILNYNFGLIGFTPSEEGGALSSISVQSQFSSMSKIGDYPIITSDAARKMLLSGAYITTVPEEYLSGAGINVGKIAKVELVYRTGNTNQMFLPYYRFYIALDTGDKELADGLKLYGAYYVPAVSGEYLTDFPVWDGSFN